MDKNVLTAHKCKLYNDKHTNVNRQGGDLLKVKIARIKKEMTQEDLAIASGICRTIISRIEKGNYNKLRFDNMKKLAEVLDCTVGELFFTD